MSKPTEPPTPVITEPAPPEAPAAPPQQEGAQEPPQEPHRQPDFMAKLRKLVEGQAKPKEAASEALLGDLRTQLANINATQQRLQQATQAVQELQGQVLQLQGQIDAIGRILHRQEGV